ncbi:SCO family protein [Coralliovum pocilloporae]|uniref:SCO family protein n=1 Tax=Coralliovum pocilloporae TaxID=3066369 RepID=UPI003307344A
MKNTLISMAGTLTLVGVMTAAPVNVANSGSSHNHGASHTQQEAGADKAHTETPKAPPIPKLDALFGGTFELTDHQGQTRKDTDWDGRYRLIFFGYTHCPAICPTTLQDITIALDELGDRAKKIQPIFVTIDPARDTPEILADYIESFTPGMVALTGSETQIADIARKYRVQRHKLLTSEHEHHQHGDGKGVDDYEAAHSSLTYLMGPDGKFLTLFPFGTTPDVLAKRLSTYVSGEAS